MLGARLPQTAAHNDASEQRNVMAMADWVAQVLKRMLLIAVGGMMVLPAAASAAAAPVGALTQLPGQLGCFTTAASACANSSSGWLAPRRKL